MPCGVRFAGLLRGLRLQSLEPHRVAGRMVRKVVFNFLFLLELVPVGAALLYMPWARFSETVGFVKLAADFNNIKSAQSSAQSSALYFYLPFYELHAVGMVVTANIQLL